MLGQAAPGLAGTAVGSARTQRPHRHRQEQKWRTTRSDRPVNHIEPVPRRIRATLGGETVLDTTRPSTCGSGRTTRSTTSRRGHQRRGAGRRAAHAATRRGRRRAARPARRRDPAPAQRRVYGERRSTGCAGTARVRLGRARRVVRGGRAGLRPPPQPLHARRRAALDAARARRARRHPAGRVDARR